jgi:hypothetical protein
MGDRGLDAATIEYRHRRSRDSEALPLAQAACIVAARVRAELAAL